MAGLAWARIRASRTTSPAFSRQGTAGLVLVLAAMAGAGWLVGFSLVLAVERVEIPGAHRLAASALRQTAAVPLGVPLPRQDLAAIAGRVSALPQIESAQVSRRWPHTIRVAVAERRPMLGVRQPEGFILIDTRGVAESRPTLPSGVLQADADPTDVEVLGRWAQSPLPCRLRITEVQSGWPHPGRR